MLAKAPENMLRQRFWQNIALKQGHTTVQELEPENVYIVVTCQYTKNFKTIKFHLVPAAEACRDMGETLLPT